MKSFIYDFLNETNNEEYIDKYVLQPFTINVLKKEQTLIEKLVSLIRFSFAEDYFQSISSKIRHFYDLYYLFDDQGCNGFINSTEFKQRFLEILGHDKEIFDEPQNWRTKQLNDSLLITDFENVWTKLKEKYNAELSALAFSQIPSEDEIAKTFKELIKKIS